MEHRKVLDMVIGPCSETGGMSSSMCYHTCSVKYEGDSAFSETFVREGRQIAALLFPSGITHPLKPHFSKWQTKGFHPDQKSRGKYTKLAAKRKLSSPSANQPVKTPDSERSSGTNPANGLGRKKGPIRKRQKLNTQPTAVPKPLLASGEPVAADDYAQRVQRFGQMSLGPTFASGSSTNIVAKAFIYPGVDRCALMMYLSATLAKNVFPMMCTAIARVNTSISHPDTGQIGLTGSTTEGATVLAAHMYAYAVSTVFKLPFFLRNCTVVNFTVRADIGGPVDTAKIFRENAALPEELQLKDLRLDPKHYPGLHWPIHNQLSGADSQDLDEEDNNDDDDGRDVLLQHAALSDHLAEEERNNARSVSSSGNRDHTDSTRARTHQDAREARPYTYAYRPSAKGTRKRLGTLDRPHAITFSTGTVTMVGLRTVNSVVSALTLILPIMRQRAGFPVVVEGEKDPSASTTVSASLEDFAKAVRVWV
jgi:hypothetical protein